jgi:ATP-binding cassette subfamily C exporter for protease/lipase/ATP-binding cassette subfamily C protein EexD
MRDLFARLRPLFLAAALFSLAINLLLLAAPLYMLQVFDRVLSSRSAETLLVLTAATAAALALMAFLDALRARLFAAAGVALDRNLGPLVLEGLLARAGWLGGGRYANGLRDVSALRAFFNGPGLLALFDAPWLPLFLALIFLFHPLLGAVALAGALVMVVLAWLNERLTRRPLERAQAAARHAGHFIDGSLRNAEVVSALGMLPAVTRRWTSLNDGALLGQLRTAFAGARLGGATKLARQLVQIAMLGTGAWLVIGQDVSAGVMVAATIILGRALAPIETLVAGWRSLVEARAAWRSLRDLLSEGKEAPATALPAPSGAIEAERVSFAFSGAERPVLRGVSFSLPAGEALGVIGPSASGKSTLLRLALGVWKPSSGTMRLDGADAAAWSRARLGAYVGYLPQDVELFSGSVAENIARLGEPDAAAVVRAAQRAHVHDMILRLPKGYDTEVGEAGQALSPGQRQRIALARALYSEVSGSPRLVVLDEPNASLDQQGDEALLQTLQGLKAEGVTVLIVAHRPSLLRGVDKLLVLREGAVEMFGPRGAVMARLTRPVQEVA